MRDPGTSQTSSISYWRELHQDSHLQPGLQSLDCYTEKHCLRPAKISVDSNPGLSDLSHQQSSVALRSTNYLCLL
ncbi:hypothetical protein LEMLEM_LOCUS5598 [Lemmus lemmus]